MRASASAFLLQYYLSRKRLQHRLAEHQQHRLNHILRIALEQVPFYKELYGITPNKLDPGLRMIDIVKTLPIIDKNLMRAAGYEHLLSRTTEPNLHQVTTGGSTGEAFQVSMTPLQRKRRVAVLYRTYFAHDVRPWHKLAIFQNTPPGIDNSTWTGYPKSAFVEITADTATQWGFVRESRPQILIGIPSILCDFANYLSLNGHHYRAKAIFCNSEMLMPKQRKTLKKIFGVEPINVYDSWEFGNIAWECPKRDGLHINSDSLLLERHPDKGILITDLYNDVMPFIRYAIGDDADIDNTACPCANPYPRLSSLKGKALECVVMADRSERAIASQLCGNLRFFKGVDAYQLVQTEPGAIELLLNHTPETGAFEEYKAWVLGTFKLTSVSLRIASSKDDFIVTAAGKRPLFYSKLKHQKSAN